MTDIAEGITTMETVGDIVATTMMMVIVADCDIPGTTYLLMHTL